MNRCERTGQRGIDTPVGARHGFGANALDVVKSGKQNLLTAQDLGIAVAVKDSQLLGFFCLSRTERWVDNKIINGLLTSLSELFLEKGIVSLDKETCLLGPACLAEQARGKQVFQQLHAIVCNAAVKRFDFAISFISASNLPSIIAARGVNTHPVTFFWLGGRKYYSYLIDLGQYRSPKLLNASPPNISS